MIIRINTGSSANLITLIEQIFRSFLTLLFYSKASYPDMPEGNKVWILKLIA
jgi:hypothetical protein